MRRAGGDRPGGSRRHGRPSRWGLSPFFRTRRRGRRPAAGYDEPGRSGGTGRRAGLKIRCPSGRAGSTPAFGTGSPSGFAAQELVKALHARENFCHNFCHFTERSPRLAASRLAVGARHPAVSRSAALSDHPLCRGGCRSAPVADALRAFVLADHGALHSPCGRALPR